jgi:hypothetical protein
MSNYFVIRDGILQTPYERLENAEMAALSKTKGDGLAYIILQQVSIATPVQISAKIERFRE